MFSYILFDLDGTLTDPKIGITKSVQYALAAAGIDEPDLDKLEIYIGPPLKESFMEFHGLSAEEAEQGIWKYRERFAPIGLFENEIYPGIAEMLSALKQKGCVLAIASSKPTIFVEKILAHFEILSYFDYVVGSEEDGTRSRKEEVVEEAIRQIVQGSTNKEVTSLEQLVQAVDKQHFAMVGDRKFDIQGAKAFGLTGIGVSYGYAQDDELEQEGADYVVSSVEELQTLLLT